MNSLGSKIEAAFQTQMWWFFTGPSHAVWFSWPLMVFFFCFACKFLDVATKL